MKNQYLTKESYYQFAFQRGELIQHLLDRVYREMMAIGNTEEQDKDDAVKGSCGLAHRLIIQRRSNDSDHVRCYLGTKK